MASFGKKFQPTKDYARQLQELKNVLEKSTPFVSRLYQGHMNYDISQPHIDALMLALPYNQN